MALGETDASLMVWVDAAGFLLSSTVVICTPLRVTW